MNYQVKQKTVMEVFATKFLEENYAVCVWKSWKQQLRTALLQHVLNNKALDQNVEKHNG